MDVCDGVYVCVLCRFDVATIHTLLSHQHFEAEIQFVPMEDHERLLDKKEKCYHRCWDSGKGMIVGTQVKGWSGILVGL